MTETEYGYIQCKSESNVDNNNSHRTHNPSVLTMPEKFSILHHSQGIKYKYCSNMLTFLQERNPQSCLYHLQPHMTAVTFANAIELLLLAWCDESTYWSIGHYQPEKIENYFHP